MLEIMMSNPIAQVQSSFGGIRKKIEQWPAVAINLIVSFLGFVLVALAASYGWPGAVASNCYEDYLVTADCYCERLRGDQPGDVWFTQPMNTISNLWFTIFGLLMAYAADSRQFPYADWWETKHNPMTQDKLYSIVFSLTNSLLGIGSICLHASFTAWGRQADMSAMYLVATFGLVYPFIKNHQVSKEQGIWIYLFLSACLIYWTIVGGTPDQTRKLFTTLLLTGWAMEIFMVDSETARRNADARRMLLTNIGIFAAGVLIWKASESNGPLCDPDSLWQGHSLWHFQSAFAIFGQYCYYLAEDHDEERPVKMVLIENAPHPQLLISDSSSEAGSVSS